MTGSGTVTSSFVYGGMPYYIQPQDWDWTNNWMLGDLFWNDTVDWGVGSDQGFDSYSEMGGTITSTRTWIGDGPPPKTIPILEESTVDSVGGYGNGSWYEGWLWTGPFGCASAVDAFGDDSFSVYPGDVGDDSWQESTGKRLIQVDSSSGTVALSGDVFAWAATFGREDSVSQGSSQMWGSFDWSVDTRALTISSDVDPTYYKAAKFDATGNNYLRDQYGNILYEPKANSRQSDGSISGDIGLANIANPNNGTPSASSAFVTYQATRATDTSWAIYNSQDTWLSSLTNNYPPTETLNNLFGLEIQKFVIGYARPNPPHTSVILPDGTAVLSTAIPGVTGTDTVQVSYQNGTYYVPGYPNSNATGDASTDNAIATATYVMNVHNEYEHPVQYRLDSKHKTEVGVYLDTPARSGIDQSFTYESPGATLAGDLLSQGALSLFVLTGPEWVATVFEFTDLTTDKLVPKPEGGNTSFDACWTHSGSTWVDQNGVATNIPPPASDFGNYQMQPAISEEFVTKYTRLDHYVPSGDASGYTGFAGQKDEQTDARTGWEQGIGHYTWAGPGGNL